jgi:hypothetical protein
VDRFPQCEIGAHEVNGHAVRPAIGTLERSPETITPFSKGSPPAWDFSGDDSLTKSPSRL